MRSDLSIDNPPPELSSDIEWMLESGQASPEMLADALAREYLQPVYRFWLIYLNDPWLAEQVVVESLSAVLMQSYNYRGESVPAWVFQIVLHVCQKKGSGFTLKRPAHDKSRIETKEDESGPVGSMAENDHQNWTVIENFSRKSRLLFIMFYVLSMSIEQAALTLKTSPETVTKQLKTIRRRLVESLRPLGYPEAELEPDRLDARIRHMAEVQWPGMALNPAKLEEMVKAIAAGAEQKKSHSHHLASIKEFILVAIVIVLAVGLIYGGNLLFPEPDSAQTPARTVVVTRLVIVEKVAAPTLTPLPTATSTPTSLPPLSPLQTQPGQYSFEDFWK